MSRARGVLLVALLLAADGRAGDGRIELSQSGAGGVFPIVLSAPGSYVLTSNLTVGPGLDAIAIPAAVSGVTLDLNGFEIAGTCASFPCAGTGSGIAGLSAARVTLRNGVVRNMPGNGIELGVAARVEDITTAANGLDGIRLGTGAVVARAIARGNGQDGLDAGGAATISDSTTFENAGDGIEIDGTGATISHCSARDNGVAGINSPFGVTVVESSATLNDAYGISVGDGSTVARSTASDNGTDGIFAGTGSNVTGNTSQRNGRHGLHVEEGTRVHDNASTENAEYGLRIQLGAAGSVHLLDNQIRANKGSGVGASAAFGSVVTGFNSISGNASNFDATVVIVRIACDQVGGAVQCPP